jgi:hypothetical protein
LSESVADAQDDQERSLVTNLLEDHVALEQRVEELEAKLGRLDELEQRIKELDERTDMLRLIEDSDQMEGKERSTALIQHAINEFQRKDRAQITFDRDRAEEILHHPDVHRTTIYTDMERCADLIGDDDICAYKQSDQTQTGSPELRFDFTCDITVDASTLVGGKR